MRFFSQFPKVPYSFDEFTPTINTQVIDMYRYVDVNRNITSDLAAYLTYSIKDGERPDQVSHKLYKTPDHHWTFLIINEKLKGGLNDWPKSYNQLEEYVNKNYGSYSVLEFLPEQEFDENNNLARYKNYFGRLEFDGRLKLVRNVEGKNISGVPVLYNSDKLQLWVENSGSSFLSNENETYNLIYEGSKKQKLAWANEFGLQWCRESYPEIYKVLNDETTIIDDNIEPFARGIIDFPETPQVFNNSERTTDMYDQSQELVTFDSPMPTDFGWEAGYVDNEDTNDDYDEVYTFSREPLILDSDAGEGDLDPSQIWERSWPAEYARLSPERLALYRDIVSNPTKYPQVGEGGYTPEVRSQLQQLIEAFEVAQASAPVRALNWNVLNPVTPETDEPYKSEWYPYGTDALGVFFMEKYLQMIKFTTSRSYSEAFNAPQSYTDSEGTRITAYDALNADINNSNYTTYYEYENDENEAKRDIVVLRESAVEPFAERYEELLNE